MAQRIAGRAQQEQGHALDRAAKRDMGKRPGQPHGGGTGIGFVGMGWGEICQRRWGWHSQARGAV